MKLPLSIRKFFGCRPRVGDEVIFGEGFGIHFEGVIVKDNTKQWGFPHYVAKGTLTIRTHYGKSIIKDDSNYIIPTAHKMPVLK